MPCRGQGSINLHFLGISMVTAQPRLQQQQRCNSSTTIPALQTSAFVIATVLACSYVRSIQQGLFIHALNHDHIYFPVQLTKIQTHAVEPHPAVLLYSSTGIQQQYSE